jgi:proton-translocating NADH-quinone oxidoreductase chain L
MLLSWVCFYEVILNESWVLIKFGSWFTIGLYFVEWGFLFDKLSQTMILIITTISFLVHLYSIIYMKNDPFFINFMSYLSLFTACMLILVTSDNLIQLFLGWESVGFCSFLLINYWTTRYKANFAGLKAMIMNRIGDYTIIIAILFIFLQYGTFDIITILGLIQYTYQEFIFDFIYEILINIFFFKNLTINNIIGFFLLIGAMSKSAQIGLHTWLPDAMEGPTPVSALIHAATMVTAGIYILIRLSPIYIFDNLKFLTYFILIGFLTGFISGLIGCLQNDVKKIIAYSTCSQLGFMLYTLGLLNFSLSLTHLINHAFFKALLFLTVGFVIHALNNEQDLRFMGGLLKLIPFTYISLLIGIFSLIGFPFLTGFYSKDLILLISSLVFEINGLIFFFLNMLTAGFTSFYSWRLIYYVFIIKTKLSKISLNLTHDVDFCILFVFFILNLGSLFFGFLNKNIYLNSENFFLFIGINNLTDYIYDNNIEFLTISFKILPLFLSFFFLFFSIFVSFNKLKNITIFNLFINNFFNYFHKYIIKNWIFDSFILISQKGFIDILYKKIFIYIKLKNFYKNFLILFDRGFWEIFGPTGIIRLFFFFIKNFSKLQSSFLYHYIFFLIIVNIFFLSILFILIFY